MQSVFPRGKTVEGEEPLSASDDKVENLAGDPVVDATTSDHREAAQGHPVGDQGHAFEDQGRPEHGAGPEQGAEGAGWSHRVRPPQTDGGQHLDPSQEHQTRADHGLDAAPVANEPHYVADDRPSDTDLERPLADEDHTQVHELNEPPRDERLERPDADQRGRDDSTLYRQNARHENASQGDASHDDARPADQHGRPEATGVTGGAVTGAALGGGAASAHDHRADRDDLDQPTQEFEPIEQTRTREHPVREPRGLERRDDYFETRRTTSTYGDEPTAQYDAAQYDQGLYREHDEHTQVMEGVDGAHPDDDLAAAREREAELQRRLDDSEARRNRAEGELERQRNLGTVTPSDQPDPVPTRPIKRTTDKFFGALGLFLLRLVLATALAIRGYQVVTNTAATEQILNYFHVPRVHLVALCCGVAMIVGAVCLLFGFLTRVVGFFIAAVSIAYLVTIVFGVSPVFTELPGYLGEYFVLLAASGLLLLFLGAGGWSIDGGLRRSRASRKVQEV